jgi:hypothetical protein
MDGGIGDSRRGAGGYRPPSLVRRGPAAGRALAGESRTRRGGGPDSAFAVEDLGGIAGGVGVAASGPRPRQPMIIRVDPVSWGIACAPAPWVRDAS